MPAFAADDAITLAGLRHWCLTPIISFDAAWCLFYYAFAATRRHDIYAMLDADAYIDAAMLISSISSIFWLRLLIGLYHASMPLTLISHCCHFPPLFAETSSPHWYAITLIFDAMAAWWWRCRYLLILGVTPDNRFSRLSVIGFGWFRRLSHASDGASLPGFDTPRVCHFDVTDYLFSSLIFFATDVHDADYAIDYFVTWLRRWSAISRCLPPAAIDWCRRHFDVADATPFLRGWCCRLALLPLITDTPLHRCLIFTDFLIDYSSSVTSDAITPRPSFHFAEAWCRSVSFFIAIDAPLLSWSFIFDVIRCLIIYCFHLLLIFAEGFQSRFAARCLFLRLFSFADWLTLLPLAAADYQLAMPGRHADWCYAADADGWCLPPLMPSRRLSFCPLRLMTLPYLRRRHDGCHAPLAIRCRRWCCWRVWLPFCYPILLIACLFIIHYAMFRCHWSCCRQLILIDIATIAFHWCRYLLPTFDYWYRHFRRRHHYYYQYHHFFCHFIITDCHYHFMHGIINIDNSQNCCYIDVYHHFVNTRNISAIFRIRYWLLATRLLPITPSQMIYYYALIFHFSPLITTPLRHITYIAIMPLSDCLAFDAIAFGVFAIISPFFSFTITFITFIILIIFHWIFFITCHFAITIESRFIFTIDIIIITPHSLPFHYYHFIDYYAD